MQNQNVEFRSLVHGLEASQEHFDTLVSDQFASRHIQFLQTCSTITDGQLDKRFIRYVGSGK